MNPRTYLALLAGAWLGAVSPGVAFTEPVAAPVVAPAAASAAAPAAAPVNSPVVAPVVATAAAESAWPAVTEATATLPSFHFRDGTVKDLRLHYRTLGKPERDASGRVTNAVLILHGTGGSGAQFLRGSFAGALFNPGQLLDAGKYFLILRDGIGHGKSAKPSDGLRAGFPRYGYEDMVAADYRLLTEVLGVDHLRLVMGTSMGGMHTWLWGQRYPQFMDALFPLASLPVEISGRNRAWRRLAMDAIRLDPSWQGGNYVAQPTGLRTAAGMLWLMGSNAALRQQEAPTLEAADQVYAAAMESSLKTLDANDLVYQLEASADYDPAPGLAQIAAPLIAVNTADDLINPPELGLLEQGVAKVPHGKAVVLPFSAETRGHGSHTVAALWQEYLAELLVAPRR